MSVLDALADVFFPPACAACDVVLPSPDAFCEACAALVLETPSVACERCAEPGRFAGGNCPRCMGAPPPFVRAWAPFEHDGSVARAIHRFKYEDRPDLSRSLGMLLARTASARLASMPGTLVPIPMHQSRFRERKYDHATLLAVAVSEASGRPVEEAWLKRERATARQVGLSDDDRAANVAGAFTATARLEGKPIVLLDDVFTTGATVREATGVLLRAGASRVSVLTLARARRESISL